MNDSFGAQPLKLVFENIIKSNVVNVSVYISSIKVSRIYLFVLYCGLLSRNMREVNLTPVSPESRPGLNFNRSLITQFS